MPLLSKSDLKFTYSWTAVGDDDPKISGEPDSNLFNRQEGYEVLYLINKFADKHKFKKKASGIKLEKMIRDELPGDVRSQEGVMDWLAKNWTK